MPTQKTFDSLLNVASNLEISQAKLKKEIENLKDTIRCKETAIKELKAMVRERDETITILYERLKEKF